MTDKHLAENSSLNASDPPKKRIIGTIIGVILAVIGIVGIVISVRSNKAVKEHEKQGRFGVIIDAGGSGTRLLIYEYKKHGGLVQVAYMKCENKGMAKYVSNTEELKNSLKQCLQKAEDKIPKKMVHYTPLYMEATAGMRLLRLNSQSHDSVPSTWVQQRILEFLESRSKSIVLASRRGKFGMYHVKLCEPQNGIKRIDRNTADGPGCPLLANVTSYNKIWNATRSVLSNSHLKFKEAETLTGKEEAIYGWTALNYLKKGFSEKSQYGGAEMGSSSTQVSFIPSAKLPKNSTDTMTVTIEGKSYTVYVHSYLCYGRGEFVRRYEAKLVKNSGFKDIVTDPCLAKGYEKNVTAEFLWAKPCCSGKYALSQFGEELKGPVSKKMYTLRGESNATECFKRVKSMLNTSRCTHGSCTFDNVYQPQLHGDFVAYGALYYPLGILNLTSKFTRSEYKAAITRLCSMPWSELEAVSTDKYKVTRCLGSTYYYIYLTHGIHFSDSNWNLEFTRKVNGASISWSLGLQLAKKDEMSMAIIDHHHKLGFGAFIGILLLSLALIISGTVIIILSNRKQSNDETSERSKLNPN